MATPEIDVFQDGGSIGDEYLRRMQAISKDPSTAQDYQDEAQRLSFLLPQTRRPTFYDMASDLSRGLAEQAASGRPPSVGYGLAAGFNLFSEGAALRRKKREEQKQQLMQAAYASVEKKRAESKALAEKAGTYEFEIELERAKKGQQGLFGGLNSVEGRALDFLARYRANPALKITNPSEYDAAVAFLASKFKTIIVDGNTVTVPVYDVAKLFGPITTATPSSGGPVKYPETIKTQEDYDAWIGSLSPGTQYEDGAGNIRTKKP